MQAFIVRPFGIKEDIDFERVHRELIMPALVNANIEGDTTAAIIEQGNIREDMFSKLLTADIVIADISIHNANVFYELGIRHALQDKRTFLIKSNKDEVPFDLKTDRYLSYDFNEPGECVEKLTDALKATISSDRQDSPVFYMLPKLVAQDREKFLAVPRDFGEEVEIAQEGKQKGKLALLASEAEYFAWEIPALRVVGNAQFYLKAYNAARETWEKILRFNNGDQEANDRLATIYQRLAEPEMQQNPVLGKELLSKSDLAVNRLLEKYATLEKNKRAEVFSLKARNTKSRWIDYWKSASPELWRKTALQSAFLIESFEDYERAYNEDLNHFYSGINALGLLTVLISLADGMPNEWYEEFDSDEAADLQLKKNKQKHQNLSLMVQASLEAEKKRLQRADKKDPWVAIAEADWYCLTSTKPGRVANLYRDAILSASDQNFEAAKRQLELYQQLNVLPENVALSLAEFKLPEKEADIPRLLLFTGHMIDKEGRKNPRFPASKEGAVTSAIKEAVLREKEKSEVKLTGIAGGACGGDIIFHEVCKELGIKTELFLALPREKFLTESVEFAGNRWIERFDALYTSLPVRILSQTTQMPKWLEKKKNYSIWERNNLWMLNSALIYGGLHMSLIALWNGEGGDDVGGTEHMVKEAKSRGSKVLILDINNL